MSKNLKQKSFLLEEWGPVGLSSLFLISSPPPPPLLPLSRTLGACVPKSSDNKHLGTDLHCVRVMDFSENTRVNEAHLP